MIHHHTHVRPLAVPSSAQSTTIFTMKRLHLVLVVNLLVVLTSCVEARAAAGKEEVGETSTKSPNPDWRDWISYAFSPPSRQQVEEGLEARWKQLEQDVSSLSDRMQQKTRQAQEQVAEIESQVESQKKLFKKRIAQDFLKQKQGWQRVRSSARAQTGIVLGGAMTFAGSALTQTTSPSIQTAQLTWSCLNHYNVTRGTFDPWFKDITAGALAVGIVAWKKGKTLSSDAALERTVPFLTIAMSIVQSVGIILDNYEKEGNEIMSPATRAAAQVISAILGTSLLSLIPLPISVIAASVAGAHLLLHSVIQEVVGNWFYLLRGGLHKFEGMDHQKKRKLFNNVKNQAYHSLEKKLLYPAKNAFEEINAAIRNETLASPTLQENVHKAIQSSIQVKVVWSVATVGIVLQVLWKSKPVKHAVSGVVGWWKHVTTKQPRAIKKRRKGKE